MKSDLKKKAQLVEELEGMRQKMSELEAYKTSYLATEKELRESEEKLRLMFESVTDGITVTDLDGVITGVNKAILRLGEFHSESDVVGTSVFETIALRDRQRALTDMLELRQQDTVGSGQYHLMKADGSEYPAEVSAGVLRNAAGNPAGFVSVIRDITGREQAEEIFQTISLRSPVGMYIVQDGQFVFANPRLLSDLGITEARLLGIKPLSRIRSEDREMVRRNAVEMLKGIRTTPYEYGVTNRGGIRWFMETVVPIQYQGKRAVLGNVLDITERKQTEERLRETRRRFRDLVNLLPQGVYEMDTEYNITFANRRAIEASGYTEEEVNATPSNALDTVIPEDRERMRKNIQRIMGGENLGGIGYTAIRKDGSTSPIISYSAPIMHDGKVVGVRGVTIDITEQKQAEEEHRLFIKTALDGFWLNNLAGEFLEVNDSYCTMTGYTREELLKMSIADIEAIENPEVVAHHITKIVEQGSDRFETQHRRKDGTVIDVEVSVNYLGAGEGQLFVFIRDITERKRVEEERQRIERLESLGTLAGGIAHDFNNILTGIMGNIGLALRHMEPEAKATQRLMEAEKASLRARDLTQQLLTFSKGSAPIKKNVAVGHLVEEAAGFALRGSNVRFELSAPDNIWSVYVDEGQINGVIHNLVINADEAMPEGGTIKIRARNKAVGLVHLLPLPRGNYVEVTVEDRGVGIPKEYLDRIFEPYFTTKQKGSGLGLATAYSILKNHDGYITVESKLGVSTTFHVFLPASKKSVPVEEETTDDSSAPGGGRILVMDDEEAIRHLLHSALTEVGYDVLLTGGGEEAVEQYARARETGKPFDAVILDLTVPGKMGGRETIQKLLEIDPGVRAIASSGYSTDPVISDFRNYGFSGVVVKPYRISELRGTLRQVVTRKRE